MASRTLHPTKDMDDTDATLLRWILVAIALLFIYFARDYPQWKAEREAGMNTKDTLTLGVAGSLSSSQPGNNNSSESTTASSKSSPATISDPDRDSDVNNSSSSPPSSSPSSQLPPSLLSPSSPLLPDKFSIRWIPYLPFALVYLILSALWKGFRWLVLHSILTAEQSSVYLMTVIEQAAQWSVHHGPEFVHTKIVAPLHIAIVMVSESPAVAALGAAIENTVIPAVLKAILSCVKTVQGAVVRIMEWIKTVAEPVRTALEWFAMECVYNPCIALWARLSTFGTTLMQATKIYLQELSKDAQDLGWALIKVGTWLWQKTLKPLGSKLYLFGEMTVSKMAYLLPWLGRKVYGGLLRPVGQAMVDGFRILRSHPTLLAGMHALASKVQQKCTVALQRLESVNWLILIETVLTAVVTTVYQYTTWTLELIWQGIKVLAMDIVPNAYSDLMTALDIVRPVVAWVVDKFVMLVQSLWKVASWTSLSVAAVVWPIAVWVNSKLVMPTMQLWQTRIYPGLAVVTSVIIVHTKAFTDAVIKTAPIVATALGPVWTGLVKMVEILQLMLAQIGSRIMQMSGGLGERLQERVKAMGPQFEVFKAQTGQVMDELVLATSNFMMDWVKKEKRD
ncbi:hypothetical protein EDD11_005714 [Mortierella claussenii]|nr:hypothetical protein EDD11_005714 [Mortierella claussenii]